MIKSNAVLVLLVPLLAAGSVACTRAPEPDSGPAPEARQITEPSYETFGDHIVHYSAQLTSRLPAEVASATGIAHSDNRAMLNITVLLQGDAKDRKPVSAAVEVQATNLTGQLQEIPVRELRDGETIYYIGEFTVANREHLTFDVTVRPEGVATSHEFSFRQQFYTD